MNQILLRIRNGIYFILLNLHMQLLLLISLEQYIQRHFPSIKNMESIHKLSKIWNKSKSLVEKQTTR